MATKRERDQREERRRAGSGTRDAKHRSGGDWTTITIPEGVTVFQPKEGSYKLDIVPYKVGKGNPYAEPGLWYYERTFFTHRGVGPNNESYVCTAKTTGGRCPVCDYRAKLARDPDADEKLVDALKPKERQLWLVFDHKEPEKGVQLFESSFHTFGKLLEKKRKAADEDETHKRDFDDWESGSTLKVLFSEESAGSYSFIDCSDIEFKPRANGLDRDLLDHGVCLDDIPKVMEYDRLKGILLQTEAEEPEDEDEDEDKPVLKKGKAKAASDEDDVEPAPKKAKAPATKEANPADDAGLEEGMRVKHKKFGVCEIVRISGDGTSLTLEDEDDETHRSVAVDEVKMLDEDKPPKPGRKMGDEEDEPAPKKGKVKKPADDEDDEDEDEPAPKKKSGKSIPKEDEWDDDFDDKPPKKVGKVNTKKKADEDDEDEDKPTPKKGKVAPDEDDDW